jgi:hypothetical protein
MSPIKSNQGPISPSPPGLTSAARSWPPAISCRFPCRLGTLRSDFIELLCHRSDAKRYSPSNLSLSRGPRCESPEPACQNTSQSQVKGSGQASFGLKRTSTPRECNSACQPGVIAPATWTRTSPDTGGCRSVDLGWTTPGADASVGRMISLRRRIGLARAAGRSNARNQQMAIRPQALLGNSRGFTC